MKQDAKAYHKNLVIAVMVALVAGFLLFRNFLSLIITALILAYLFKPIYERISKKTKSRESAATLTLLLSIVIIIIPIVIVIVVTLLQSTAMINDFNRFISQHDVGHIIQNTLAWVNRTASEITGNTVNITYHDLASYITKYASNFAGLVIGFITGWIGSLGSIITNVIIYMYVFVGVLVYGDKLTKLVRELNPLGDKVTDLYLEKMQGMTKAMVKGQFTISVIQGVLSTIVLALVGVPYTMFFLVILTFMSIIPLGAGILTIPLGIIIALTGNPIGGIIIVLNHVLLVTNIDNILKPKLVPKEVRLHPALLLLAIFGGMGLFGFLGIIIGPVIMIMIITTLTIYSKQYAQDNQKKASATKKSA